MITFRQTIGFRLIFLSFLMLTLPLLIDATIVFFFRYEASIAESKRYLTESALLRVLPIGSYEPIPAVAFDVLARELGIKEKFPEKPDPSLHQALADLAKINHLYDLSVITIDDKGRYIVVASAQSEIVGTDVSSFFIDPNPFSFVEEYGDPVDGYFAYGQGLIPYYISTLGYLAKDGAPMGVLVAVIDGRPWLQEVLAKDTTYYPVRFALLDPIEIVVGASDPSLLFNYFQPLTKEGIDLFILRQNPEIESLLPKKPLKVLQGMTPGGFLRFEWEAEEQLGVIEPIPWWDYTLLSYVSKREIYEGSLRDFVGIFVGYLLVLILGSILVYFITRRWMRPVQSLGLVMTSVEQGDFSARYEKDKWGVHFNALGLIFNEMIEKLLINKERAETERVQRDLFARELKLGKEAQQRLLREPDQYLGSVDVAQSYVPASEVGGDFYDIFRKPNGKLVLMIADASGKGVLACCFSLAARNMLKTLALSTDDVGEVLVRGNNLFCDDTGDSGMFVTVELAQYDYETRVLTYYSLGHNPGIVCRKDGAIEMLEIGDMAMGVLIKEKRVIAGQKQLDVGDTVILYTDGVTEMHNKDSQLFGEKRLTSLIQKKRHLEARELLREIEKEVYAFADGREQFDDFTLIVVKING